MLDLFASLKRQVMLGTTLPSNRFFTPKREFFDLLISFYGVRFVDAGCGLGDLPQEAKEHGIQMLGIDLCHRPGQNPNVLHIDATTFIYGPSLWPVICRPNHDGWAYDAVRNAHQRGACALYVGLDRNIENDLDDLLFNIAGHWPDVGEEGEGAWLLRA